MYKLLRINIGHKKNSTHFPDGQFVVHFWRQQEKWTHGHYPAISSTVCWHDIEKNEDHNFISYLVIFSDKKKWNDVTTNNTIYFPIFTYCWNNNNNYNNNNNNNIIYLFFYLYFFSPQNTNNDKTRKLHKSNWKWRGSAKRNHEAYRQWAPSVNNNSKARIERIKSKIQADKIR